jgi:glycosyltransferase involved in cell wall biosynthesis
MSATGVRPSFGLEILVRETKPFAVIVAGVVYPEPSPTGKCALQYAEALAERADIGIVFVRMAPGRIDGLRWRGFELFGLSSWRLAIENWLRAKRRGGASRALGGAFSAGIWLMRSLGRFQNGLFWPNNLRWFAKKARRKLEAINRTRPIDIVFTINSPYAAHLAGLKFKLAHPGVRWMTYSVDPLSGDPTARRAFFLRGAWGRRDRVAERLVYLKADANFVSDELYIRPDPLFRDAQGKTRPLPYVLSKPPSVEASKYFDPSKTNLLFAGRFYRKIRNPEYLLEVFSRTKDPNMLLHLYAAGDCDDIIERYAAKSAGRIIRHPVVGQDVIREVISAADILVNVGNTTPSNKPSKTFEYISTGRPIVHFHVPGSMDGALSMYPLVLQVEQSDQEVVAKSQELERFCLANRGARLAWVAITGIYRNHTQDKLREVLLSGAALNSR